MKTAKRTDEESLMNRIDVKYVIKHSDIAKVLDCLMNEYVAVCDDKGMTILKYYSLYFDTESMQMYEDHISDCTHRQKLRIREYESHEKFLEIKDKLNGVTVKTRIPVTSYEIDGNKEWISENLIYDTKTLSKKLDVKFCRMTFVNSENSTRITLDLYVHFHSYITGKNARIDDAILEVKKQSEELTDIEKKLNSFGIFKTKFSKYKTGLQLTQF